MHLDRKGFQFERERYEIRRTECELECIEQRREKYLERGKRADEPKSNSELRLAKFKLMMEAFVGK